MLPETENDAIPINATRIAIPECIADIEHVSATGRVSVQNPLIFSQHQMSLHRALLDIVDK